MRALLVAGGDPPPAELLAERFRDSDLVIAVDRGLEALLAGGLMPQVLVGDLDSLDPQLVDAAAQASVEVRQSPREKNETDLELAVRAALAEGADRIHILGATGGRTDHLLGNISVLRWLHGKGVQAEMEDGSQTISVENGSCSFSGTVGETVSILPAGSRSVVSARGLHYPLDKLELTADTARGISNVLSCPEVELEIDGPVFLIRTKNSA